MLLWNKFVAKVFASETIDRGALVQNVETNSISLISKNNEITRQVSVTSNEPYIDLELKLTEEEEEHRRKSFRFKVKKFFWDGFDKHPEEQKYLAKLDFFLISSSMLGYFIKNLNQSNVATAYVNGMLEYYEMDNNQYNYMVTLWTVGYIIGQIPGNLILHRISARVYLACLEVLWAVFTLAMIRCHNLKGMYALRFFIGLLESSYFPAMEYLLGSNYSAAEMSTRSSYFAVASGIATLITGPLQLAIIKNFKTSSLPPFKWLFVFDAVISFGVAIITFFFDPNTPSTTDAWYFTAKDKLVGLERRRRIGAQLNTREKFTFAKVKSFFNSWHIYVFPVLFLTYNNTCLAATQPTFTTWMKIDLGLSEDYYNTYPSINAGLGIFFALLLAYIHNYSGGKKNHYYVWAYFFFMILGCILLAVWNIPRWLHWLSYTIISIPTMWGQPFIFTWVNRLLMDNDLKRNFVVVATNNLAYVTGAWVPIFVWSTNDQPRYKIGFTYNTCLAAFGFFMTTVAWYFTRRDAKRALALEAESLEETSDEA